MIMVFVVKTMKLFSFTPPCPTITTHNEGIFVVSFSEKLLAALPSRSFFSPSACKDKEKCLFEDFLI